MSTKDVKLRVNLSALLLSSTALCLVSGNSYAAAFPACTPAGSTCYYVAVQPIDVCSDAGANCAPFNTLSKVGNPGAATSTTPIGFVDTTTGKDVTRAIWNQIGIDIAWAPIAQYNKTLFQTINIVQCSTTNLPCATTNPTGNTSTDFLTLSQQPQISQGTSGFPNPRSPNAPVSSQPTVVNMFFVNTLNPPPGTAGPLYGFAWINNNGLVIGKNTFVPPTNLQKPRFDTLAHELGHNLGGDHITFGAGQSPNLLTAGANGSGTALRTIPTSTSDALTRLGPGESCTIVPPSTACTADQLDTSAIASPSEQDEADMSGLLNRIASSTTTASKPGTAGAAATALMVTTTGSTTAIANPPAASKPPTTSINFDIVGPSQGAPGETLLGVIITLGPGVKFDPSNTVRFTPNGKLVNETDYNNGNEEDRGCSMSDTQCLIIQLKKPGLPQGQDLMFSQGIILAQQGDEGDDGGDGAKKPVTLNQLQAAGVYVTYLFSDGLVITSQLSGPNSAGQLTGDSLHPTSVVPTRLDPNPSFKVSNTGARSCVPNAYGLCESPAATGGQDGDPRCETPMGTTTGGAPIRGAAVVTPPPSYGLPPVPVSCPVPYGG